MNKLYSHLSLNINNKEAYLKQKKLKHHLKTLTNNKNTN